MGTSARINVFDGDDIIVSIYRHMDGYPDGLGQEVADFVKGITITDGFVRGSLDTAIANGMGCLAAQLVKHLKVGVGSVYLRNVGSESHGEDYTYNLREQDNKITIEVLNN